MKSLRLFLIGFTSCAAIIWFTAARAAPVAATVQIEPGDWRLSEIGGSAHRRACMAEPIDLALTPIRKNGCAVRILENGHSELVVHYVCAGSGTGRAVLQVIDTSSVRLQTQGISNGAPFAVDYEGRRLGRCQF